MSVDYDIFSYAKTNNVKKLKEVLDDGVDPDEQDFDQESTPLHYACANGAKQTIELLVARGADVNIQNKRGNTPLHMLITSRFDNQALWLIRHGADPNLENRRGESARDLAHNFVQQEMDDAVKLREEKGVQVAEEPNTETQETKVKSSNVIHSDSTAPPVPVRIYFPNKTYKSVGLTPNMTAYQLKKHLAEKMGILKFADEIDVYEDVRGAEKRVQEDDVLVRVRKKWPLIYSKNNVDETDLHCHFLVKMKRSAPSIALNAFDKATQ